MNLNKDFNIASLLADSAKLNPDKLAVIAEHRADVLKRKFITLHDLDVDSSNLAVRLAKRGFKPNTKVVVMLPPGIDFIITSFALFKIGAVPVLADPGMGIKRMVKCLANCRPEALIGVGRAHLLTLLFPRYFKELKLRVTLGSKLGWGGYSLKALMQSHEPSQLDAYKNANDDLAAILFTSGATGMAKGVLYTHQMFKAQIEAIKNDFGLWRTGVDLATFPLFSLFSPALGLTAVIPDMNPSKPSKVDPKKIVDSITRYGVTSMFASPTLLTRVGEYLENNDLALDTLKTVISAGAPVPPKLAVYFSKFLKADAKLITPYGATEAVPLTSIDSKEIEQETKAKTEQGFGMCVGKPLGGTQIAIIKISDDVIKNFDDIQLPSGEIGEIAVKSLLASRYYYNNSNATNLSIIEENDGSFWRRMGDVGWLDAHGRLWFCGRKNYRVVCEGATFFTIACEAIFNNHPLVKRSALVGVGGKTNQKPAIVIEPKKYLNNKAWLALKEELLALAKTNPRTLNINIFLKHNNFPVDVRHNAKINREKLSHWATMKLLNNN